MEYNDIFKFEDFLNGNKIEDLKKMKSNLLREGFFSDRDSDQLDDKEVLTTNDEYNEYEIDQSLNPYNTLSDEEDFDLEDNSYGDIENDELMYSDSDNEDSYVLYKDKSEEFVCDIAVEGVKQSDTEVRLVVESDDWTLMFSGKIVNGKCIIPIKKLSILSEGQTGNIKLEVNADGNLFTPWEDRFIVKTSKKVTVSMNESKSKKSKSGVNVKVIK